MPADYPAFPHHSQITAYFDDYIDHFGLRSRIRFGMRRRARASSPTGCGR